MNWWSGFCRAVPYHLAKAPFIIYFLHKMERETGLKPATSALARQRSINWATPANKIQNILYTFVLYNIIIYLSTLYKKFLHFNYIHKKWRNYILYISYFSKNSFTDKLINLVTDIPVLLCIFVISFKLFFLNIILLYVTLSPFGFS